MFGLDTKVKLKATSPIVIRHRPTEETPKGRRLNSYTYDFNIDNSCIIEMPRTHWDEIKEFYIDHKYRIQAKDIIKEL